jgi:predicted nucleic acid-binding Zn finger protein
MSYCPGTPTVPVKVGPGRYCIDSFRGEMRTYEVDTVKGTCSCPHFVGRLSQIENAECKHLRTCRDLEASQPQPTKLERAAAIAETLPDADLKQYAAERVGTAAGAACLLELAKRQAERQPRPIPPGVMELLAGATEAEKARALEIYAS